uniref:condensation domain-containing protein n=1 Tax=Pleionea sediminis TaxID=2569479 RepID=UPI001FEAA775
MTIIEILNRCQANGISLQSVNGQLKVSSKHKAPIDAELIKQLKVNKEKLLAWFDENKESATIESIPARPANKMIPLSVEQQAMFLRWQTDPESAEFNTPSLFQLSGEIDCSALSSAWQTVCLRHESLRTFFKGVGDEAEQVIAPQAPVLEVVDAHSWPQPRLQQELLEVVGKGFNLVQSPPVRAILFRTADNEAILSLVMHHLITDGWSMDLIFGELAALYNAELANIPIELPAVALQYADYAVWQRSQVSSRDYQEQWSYWSERLQDLT